MKPKPAHTFDASQLRAIARARREGVAVSCPACGSRLGFDPVPRPEAVSYVRARVWVRCGGCGRAGVVDRP